VIINWQLAVGRVGGTLFSHRYNFNYYRDQEYLNSKSVFIYCLGL